MDTITAILITVHIIISIALVALVLLNSGKGGGLSDMLGGPGSSGNIGQTLAERNLSSCLLYTSPSPRDVNRSRMPSSA